MGSVAALAWSNGAKLVPTKQPLSNSETVHGATEDTRQQQRNARCVLLVALHALRRSTCLQQAHVAVAKLLRGEDLVVLLAHRARRLFEVLEVHKRLAGGAVVGADLRARQVRRNTMG